MKIELSMIIPVYNVEKYIEKSPLLGRYMFLDDIKGNVHGYKLLYQVMQKKKGERS